MLKDFLNKYDTLILDMDGVMTSEQRYWDAAALTTYEMLHSCEYFGDNAIDFKKVLDNTRSIRKEVFFNDQIITILKKKGVNSNWDLAYVTLAFYLVYGKDMVLEKAKAMSEDILFEYDKIAKLLSQKLSKDILCTSRSGGFWKAIHKCFQDWYLGNDKKAGLVYCEEPLFEASKMKSLLQELSMSGKRLCIGTGRPKDEIIIPLKNWNVIKYFDQNAIITFDDVIMAERAQEKTLTKPHPYVFLKALYGSDYPDEKILCADYDKEKIKSTLVIGDAGADILAAQAMGADFCAVLTGVSGEEARGYFEELNSQYILNSLLDLKN